MAFGTWCLMEPLDTSQTLVREVSEYQPAAHFDLEPAELFRPDRTPVRRRAVSPACPVCPASASDEKTTLPRRPFANIMRPAGAAKSARQAAKAVRQPVLDGALDEGASASSIAQHTDALELILAPGDFLVVPSSTAEGSGRLLMCLALPHCNRKESAESQRLHSVWPASTSTSSKSGGGVVTELWSLRVLESSRRQQGFAEADIVMFVESATACLTMIGEVDGFGEVVRLAPQVLHIWQSPLALRAQLRMDLMMETLADMENSYEHELLEQMARHCTFAAISFWQRYLRKLAKAHGTAAPEEVVQKWLPLKGDCLPLEQLASTLQSVGWISMSQIPQLCPPAVFHMPAEGLSASPMDLDCIRAQPHATTYGGRVSMDQVSSYANPTRVRL